MFTQENTDMIFIVVLFDDMVNILNLKKFTLIDTIFNTSKDYKGEPRHRVIKNKTSFLQMTVLSFTYWNSFINKPKEISSNIIKLRNKGYVLFQVILSTEGFLPKF